LKQNPRALVEKIAEFKDGISQNLIEVKEVKRRGKPLPISLTRNGVYTDWHSV
jgi:hypothetical protein